MNGYIVLENQSIPFEEFESGREYFFSLSYMCSLYTLIPITFRERLENDDRFVGHFFLSYRRGICSCIKFFPLRVEKGCKIDKRREAKCPPTFEMSIYDEYVYNIYVKKAIGEDGKFLCHLPNPHSPDQMQHRLW